MKISGFSLVRNGTLFDYPYLESLRSLLPLVDELIINVGIGEDDTRDQIAKFAQTEGQGKVSFFESPWNLDDPAKKRGGLILSEQTNLALDRCTGDWCLYLQADEVLHEVDYFSIRETIFQNHHRPEVEGLLFDYRHFYGSYDVVQVSRSAYRREIRGFRRSSGARSVGDAQSFRLDQGKKLSVVHTQARIFHYGWVRTPEAMKNKTFFMDQLYHGDPTLADSKTGTPHTGDNYRYKRIWGLRSFQEEHPSVMTARIQSKGWHWDLENSDLIFSWKDLKKVVLDFFEKMTGYRLFEYRSYKQIR